MVELEDKLVVELLFADLWALLKPHSIDPKEKIRHWKETGNWAEKPPAPDILEVPYRLLIRVHAFLHQILDYWDQRVAYYTLHPDQDPPPPSLSSALRSPLTNAKLKHGLKSVNNPKLAKSIERLLILQRGKREAFQEKRENVHHVLIDLEVALNTATPPNAHSVSFRVLKEVCTTLGKYYFTRYNSFGLGRITP